MRRGRKRFARTCVSPVRWLDKPPSQHRRHGARRGPGARAPLRARPTPKQSGAVVPVAGCPHAPPLLLECPLGLDQLPEILEFSRSALSPHNLRTVRQLFVNGQDLGKDRKSTRLNSSHLVISYAVFCLKKKK